MRHLLVLTVLSLAVTLNCAGNNPLIGHGDTHAPGGAASNQGNAGMGALGQFEEGTEDVIKINFGEKIRFEEIGPVIGG